MCGIVGIASQSLNQEGKSIFEDLMVVSNLRGRVGAGVVSVHGVDGMRGVKSLYSGCDLLDMAAFRNLMKEEKTRILLGHTRYPTVGASDDTNNVHPHFMENITGVHNGTLTHVEGAQYGGKTSDSHQFYRHASEVGFKKALAGTRGAYCFVYLDHAAKTLNFIRNFARPLWFVKHLWGKDGQSLLWASEKEMLEFVLARRKMLAGAEFVELPVNELWSIPHICKQGDDFTVETPVFAGTDFYRPVSSMGQSATNFRNKAEKKSSSTVGKVIYVWDATKRQFVEKIHNGKPEQVSLPRSSSVDGLQGKEKVSVFDGKGGGKGASVEQRPKASSKVSLGNSGSSFLKNIVKGVEKHISQAERDFEAETEAEFSRLLAAETNGYEDTPWVDNDDNPLVETMKGYWIPKKDYLRILQNGCVWTGDPATEYDELYWIEKEVFIFRNVLNDPEAIEDLRCVYPNDPYFSTTVSYETKQPSYHNLTLQ